MLRPGVDYVCKRSLCNWTEVLINVTAYIANIVESILLIAYALFKTEIKIGYKFEISSPA